VFVHGFLVDGTLWSRTAEALAAAGVHSYAPDWPLGSHTIPRGPGQDQSPRGVARHILAFLEALDLRDVTLVGNDSGGALSQFVVDTDPTRIGALVLTNCDAFDQFPPAPFDVLFKSFRYAWAIRPLMEPTRLTFVRHSALGFGLLAREPFDRAQTRAWVAPCLHDRAIRQDSAAFARAVDPQELLGVTQRLRDFDRPALLVWGDADRFFKISFAERLRDTLPDARLVPIPGGRTFVPLDHPQRLADEIVAFRPARVAPTAT
jgi:pimeloyl-ACP methyl ester carboxylesterase